MKMQQGIARRISPLLVGALFSVFVLATPDRVAGGDSPVFPPNSEPYGQSYPEWHARWWQWAYSIPVDENPLYDDTGEKAGNGQDGPVFYIGGAFDPGIVVRTITVPQGKALFFPVINFENDNYCPPNDPPLGEEELRQQTTEMMDMATDLACEIDDRAVEDLPSFRAQSPVFSITFPENNVFQFMGCDTPAGIYDLFVDEGYYVMVRPLEKGEHTIHFHGSVPDAGFTLDVTYHITVK